jgi:hypothetical protein
MRKIRAIAISAALIEGMYGENVFDVHTRGQPEGKSTKKIQVLNMWK